MEGGGLFDFPALWLNEVAVRGRASEERVRGRLGGELTRTAKLRRLIEVLEVLCCRVVPGCINLKVDREVRKLHGEAWHVV